MKTPPKLAPVIGKINPVAAQRMVSFALLPWYPASFMSSTRGWSVIARGIYRELLDAQWEIGGLPVSPADLQHLIRATNSEWKHWATVEVKFPISSDGMRRNAKLEEHRARSIERSKKAAASAHQRWRKDHAPA